MKISKTRFFLFLIFVLALALRITAAAWVDVGTDEMIYTLISLNIIDAGRLGTVEQSPLFFYLTDLGYKVAGGLGPISARLPSIIFGSFAVFLIFALALELFGSSKAALLSALLYALSGYVLQYNTEMDMTAFFFALLSMYFFIRVLRGDTGKLYFSVAAFALAVLTKNIVLLFAPAYVLFFLYVKFLAFEGNLKTLNTKTLRTAFLSILLFGAMLFPIFAYNYLTYTEKGVTDYYVSNILGIGESVHAGLEGKTWAFSRMVKVVGDVLRQMLHWEAPLLLLGFLGLFLSFRERLTRKEAFFLLFTGIFLVTYIAGETGSPTHFLWITLILGIFSGQGLLWFAEGLAKQLHKPPFSAFRFSASHFLLLLVLLAFLSNLVFMNGLHERSALASTVPLWKFVHEHIPPEAFVVIDPVIYRGTQAWAFHDRHYLDGVLLPTLLEQLEKIPSEEKQEFPFFFITCDSSYSNCGWKPEDLERIKNFVRELQQVLIPKLEKIGELQTEHRFSLYQGFFALPPAVLEAVDQTHVFWFYPVGWKYPEQAVDTVHPEGWGKLISGAGLLILYGEVFLALGSLFFVARFLRGNSSSEQKLEKTSDS